MSKGIHATIVERIQAAGGLRELSRQTGVSAATLSRVVSGERTLSIAALEVLATHFGLQLTSTKRPKRS